jgi:hypothetical protein
MAKAARSTERSVQTTGRTLKRPGVFLLRMAVFLALAGFIAAILAPQLQAAFLNNPGLNGLIVAVLLIGILHAFRQVLRLYPEVGWVNEFRIADPGLGGGGREPRLLAPMAAMLRDRRGTLSLSTQGMRTIMDSIGSRLDEARDTGRYLTGLMVFLGLLGTFWGLLDTITSVGKTIGALDTKATESSLIFEELKSGLAAPLRGMGTAFSSSLLGLAGSLILGFLDLQASHAHNRFYNELEEWLSGITELAPAEDRGAELANARVFGVLAEMQRTLSAMAQRLEMPPADTGPGTAVVEQSVQDLSKGVDQLVRQLRAEQKVVREWLDDHTAQQGEVMQTVREVQEVMGDVRSQLAAPDMPAGKPGRPGPKGG